MQIVRCENCVNNKDCEHKKDIKFKVVGFNKGVDNINADNFSFFKKQY